MRRFEIVGTANVGAERTTVRRVGGYSRLKLVAVALVLVSSVIGFLIAAFVLGSIIAIILTVVVVLTLALGLATSMIRRLSGSRHGREDSFRVSIRRRPAR